MTQGADLHNAKVNRILGNDNRDIRGGLLEDESW